MLGSDLIIKKTFDQKLKKKVIFDISKNINMNI